jgi:group I intron endonuclease
MLGYIYKITNKFNQKSYIGFSTDPKRRITEHRRATEQTLLAKAIKKYGWNNFDFEILAEDLLENEDKFIQQHCTLTPNGYNMQQGGFAPPIGEYRTKQMKEASKVGTQKALKGKTYEEIHGAEKAKHLKALRALCGAKNKGKTQKQRSKEHCENLSKALKGKPGTMLNKSHTEQTKTLQREWHNNKKRVVSRDNERLWVDADDWRLSHPDWQIGLKWKNK